MSARFYVCPVSGRLPWKVVDTCGSSDETLCLCETQEKADLIAANMERCSNQDAEKWKRRDRSGVLPAVKAGTQTCTRWGCGGDHAYHYHDPSTGELTAFEEA